MADADALSKLIQLHAGRNDIRLAWVDNGIADLMALCTAHAVKARIAKHFWTATRELMQMPEINQLPEALRAQIASIVLKAQVFVDLEGAEHAKRLAALDKPKGAA